MEDGIHRADNVQQIRSWYQDHVRGFLETFAPERIDALDRDLKRIEALREQIGGECAVCFVGHSGVGKSTLINALVDDARSFLPQGGVGPLTAQATSVRWADTPRFVATYRPPAGLNRLLFSLERYHDHGQAGAVSATESASAGIDLDSEDREEAERDAVDAAAEAKKGSRRIDTLVRQARLLVRGASDADLEITYLADCLRAALGQPVRHGHEPTADDAPRIEVLRRMLRLAKEKKAYRREGNVKDRDFIDDLRRHAAGHLAPLIETLDVGWNSDVLSAGLALVDLPGLGIANDQYREVTQRWIREKARAIALVVDRGITQDSAELLRASGFLGRLLHAADDPSADPVRLLVVATKLDLTADDEWLRDRDHNPDDARPWTAHFASVQERMATHLRGQVKDEIVGALRQSASDPADADVDRVAKRLLSGLTIHVVAALQFRRLARQDPEDLPRIRKFEESGIPQLRKCLQVFTSDRDELLNERIVRAADQFGRRILGILDVLRSQEGDGARENDGGAGVRAELRSFLFGRSGPGAELRARQGAFREFLLQTGKQRIHDTVETAGHVAEKAIRGYLGDLGDAHWATLRAAVRRGGTFVGARRIDLPNDFAVRIDEPVGLAWSRTILASVRQRTREHGKDREHFMNRVADWALAQESVDPERIKAIQKQACADGVALDAVGGEQVEELRGRVREQLLQRIGSEIRRECRSFVDARDDVGRGVKRRILDLFGDLVPMVMETAKDVAVKVMRLNYQAVEQEVRDAFDALPDPFANVEEAIAPKERADPLRRRQLLTGVGAVVTAAPVRVPVASGDEQHAVSTRP